MVGVFCVLTSSDKTPFFFSSAVLHRVFAKVIRIANRVVLSISKFFFCQWKILQELIYLTASCHTTLICLPGGEDQILPPAQTVSHVIV